MPSRLPLAKAQAQMFHLCRLRAVMPLESLDTLIG